MKFSNFFIPTLKESPSDVKMRSHDLMIRSGMIRQETSGIYSWMPLGFRVLKKIIDKIEKLFSVFSKEKIKSQISSKFYKVGAILKHNEKAIDFNLNGADNQFVEHEICLDKLFPEKSPKLTYDIEKPFWEPTYSELGKHKNSQYYIKIPIERLVGIDTEWENSISEVGNARLKKLKLPNHQQLILKRMNLIKLPINLEWEYLNLKKNLEIKLSL